MPNFDDILDKTLESVERPPLAPIGEYIFQVTKLPEPRDLDSPKGSWKVVEFPMQAVRPTDSVDPDMMAAYGEAKNIRVRNTFMFDKNDEAASAQTEFRLKTFLQDHLGIPSNMSLKEALNASVNKQCIGTLRYRADANSPDIQYHDLGKTAPLE